jgi:hypothetical protein
MYLFKIKNDMSDTNSFISLLSSYIPLLSSCIPLLSSFAGGVFRLLKIDSLKRGDLRKLQDLKIAHGLFDKFETDFEKQFFENEWKEACFYMQSGIKTNYKSIPQYIRLKDNLGLNYTWADIRKAKVHLDLSNDDIKINLKSYERILYSVVLMIFTLIVLMTPILMNYVFQLKTPELTYLLGLILLCIMPAIFGYLLVLNVEPIFIAKNMEKRLKILQG